MTRKTAFTPTGSSLDETTQSAIKTLDSANDTIDSLRKNATSQLNGDSASYSDKFLRTIFPQLATSMATTAVGVAATAAPGAATTAVKKPSSTLAPR